MSVTLLAVLFYGTLLCIALISSRPRIEQDLKLRATGALEELEDISAAFDLRVDGRDVVIDGEVHGQGQSYRVLEALGAVNGIRVVEDRISIRSPESSSLVIRQVNDYWVLEGQVGSSDVATGLEEALRMALKPGEKLQGGIMIEAHTLPSLWQEPLGKWFAKYPSLVSGNRRLEIMNNNLRIFGDVFSEQSQKHVLAHARSHFSGSGLEITDKIAVVRAPDPPQLTIEQGEDGNFMVVGQVRELAFKERVVELIREGGEGNNVSEQLSFGEHIRTAPWETPLIRLLPALVTEVEGLQLAISESVFMMAGAVHGNEKKQAIDELTAQAFSGITVEVENQLSIFVAPDPASFVISRGEDGVWRLGGLLPNAQLVDRFLEAATNELEAGRPPPLNEMKIGENVSDAPWVDAMVALINPFMINVEWGALSIHEDRDGEHPLVALEAEVTDPSGSDVLRALVQNAFPTMDEPVEPAEQPRYKRLIDLRIAKPPGPSDEDIAALEKATAETVIYFDSTSFRINPEERKKLSELAERFTKVPGASLALLGYTDPYGNASYNRELSGKRCKAVRDTLVEMGIEFLLLEIEQKGETEKSKGSRSYKSARRVEFELR
ncbi:MAG: OmpA family protein [Verrucomicrobiaceae bacterium]|nr:OmpA family protein [Verrucomicrobiaceae bacterium]